MEALNSATEKLNAAVFTPKEAIEAGLKVSQDGAKRTAFQLLSFPDMDFSKIMPLVPELADTDPEIQKQIERDALYSNYLARQARDIELLRRDEAQKIPSDFDYDALTGLSNELKGKLKAARPESLAQAARLDGMTPAGLTLILGRLRRDETKRRA